MQGPNLDTLQPRVVFIFKRFIFDSVLSNKAMNMIQDLAKPAKHDWLKDDCLVKVALRLSKATSVAK